MGTPLKSLKLLITPGTRGRTRLSPQLSPLCISPTATNQLGTKRSARKNLFGLDYSPRSPQISITPSVKINIISDSPIKKSKHALLVNTPNKNHILKCGLSSLTELPILGRGKFGIVVRGTYAGQDVAVKVIKTKSITNEQNALGLLHANVVKTIDVIVRSEQHSIIVMEYLPDSKVLQSVIDNESIEIKRQNTVKWALDITAGLKYIHSQGVLHLDLKPANVLVTQGNCKICDFGSSKLVQDDSQSGTIVEGTVQYSAPEILIGNGHSFASDTYSLGILMWQMRYRENPYMMLECRDAIIYNVVKYGLRPRAQFREDVEDPYSALYRSCWAYNPSIRPSLENVEKQLRNLPDTSIQNS